MRQRRLGVNPAAAVRGPKHVVTKGLDAGPLAGAATAGLPPPTCCHTFRATGITAYPLERGDPRARAADRGACVAEDDEALRLQGRHGDGR